MQDDNIATNVAPSSEPTKSLNVRIPEELHKDLAKRAIDKDTSIQALAIQALRTFLEAA